MWRSALKRQLHWPLVLLFFISVALFIYRIPLLQNNPSYFELAGDLEVPIYFGNLVRLYYPIWNDLLGVLSLQTAFQINVLALLGAGEFFGWSPMRTVQVVFVAGTALSGFLGYLATYLVLTKMHSHSRNVIAASLISGLLLVFDNLWTTDLLHYGKKISFAYAPVVFVLFWFGFREKRYSYILAGTIAMVLYTAAPRDLLSATLLFALVAVYGLVEDALKNGRDWRATCKSFLLYVRYGVLAVIAYIGLDAYRLLPLLYRTLVVGFPTPYLPTLESAIREMNRSTVVNALRYDLYGSLNLSFNIYSMAGHRAYMDPPVFLQSAFAQQLIFYLPFVVFFSALSVAFLRPLNRDSVLLLLNLCLWTYLSTGLNPNGFPLTANLYYWLMFSAPFHQYIFWAFRFPTMIWELSLVFGGMSLGVFSVRVLNHISKPKVPRANKILGVAFLGLLLFAIFLPAWPLFTGNLGGVLQPVKVPDEYFQLNEWLRDQQGNFKVLWLPFFGGSWYQIGWLRNQTDPQIQKYIGVQWWDSLSSARPTYQPWIDTADRGTPMQSYLNYVLSQGYTYPFDLLQSNRTQDLGEILAPLSIRYVILDTANEPSVSKTESMLQVLLMQKDLSLVREMGIFYVFENKDYAPPIFSASRTALVEGGQEALSALTSLAPFNLTATPLIFLDEQTTWNRSVFNASDLVILHDWNNLLPIVDPKDTHSLITYTTHQATYYPAFWAKAEASDPRYGIWTDVLAATHIPNWDFDFGKGFVFTSKPGIDISFPVNIPNESDYDPILRYLPNHAGGQFEFMIDGTVVSTIDTQSNVTSFAVADLGPEHLTAGTHIFTLRNILGFNAVNYVMIVPSQMLSVYRDQVTSLLSNKQLLYIKLPGVDFEYQNATVTSSFGGAAANGWAMKFGEKGSAWTYIEPPRPGKYIVAISDPAPAPAGLEVQIGNYSFAVQYANGSARIAYTPPIYLDQQKYALLVSKTWGSPIIDAVLVYSASNNETLNQFLERDNNTQILSFQKITPTEYLVTANSTEPFWIFMAESYDPSWVAYLNGHAIDSTLSFQSINGFYVHATGKQQITIEYILQPLFNYGSAISGASLAVILAIIFMDVRKHRKRIR